MKKSLAYWQSRWNSIDQGPYADPDHPKVIGLLLEYTEALGIKDDFIWSGLHGSSFFRGITGHWGRNHVNSVTNVISRFFSNYNFNEGESHKHYYSTEYLLGYLKSQIGVAELNPFGDLSLIFEVIKQNTGVDYHLVQSVTKKQLDDVQTGIEKQEMNAVATLVGKEPTTHEISTLPTYNKSAQITLPANKNEISVQQLKSLLMQYKSSSSYHFGETPEIKNLKALCHNKIRYGATVISEQEVREAITSATGIRSKSNRIDFFNNMQQLQPTDNTSRTVAEIGNYFNIPK